MRKSMVRAAGKVAEHVGISQGEAVRYLIGQAHRQRCTLSQVSSQVISQSVMDADVVKQPGRLRL